MPNPDPEPAMLTSAQAANEGDLETPSVELLSPPGFKVSADVHNAWDIIFKVLTTIGAIVVFTYGIYSYSRTTADSYKTEFWRKQMEVYSTLSDTAGLLATCENEEKRAAASATFWQLYNGKARLFIDASVDRQMTFFAAALRSYEDGTTPDKSKSAMIYYSLEIALACRDSLSRAWQVDLGSVTKQERAF